MTLSVQKDPNNPNNLIIRSHHGSTTYEVVEPASYVTYFLADLDRLVKEILNG